MTEPLDLEPIKARYDPPGRVEGCDDPDCWECQAALDIAALIAEVERLRVELVLARSTVPKQRPDGTHPVADAEDRSVRGRTFYAPASA